MIPVKPFIELMRRASKCRFSSVLLNNRMLMQCYDIDIDSDVGMHYILHIPDDEKYSDPLYDETLVLYPKQILDAYNTGHAILTEEKKKEKAKPKEVNEELYFRVEKKHATFKFVYYVKDKVVTTTTCRVPYPVDQNGPAIMNIVSTYENILLRLKVGGRCVILNGIRQGILRTALTTNTIVYYIVKLNGVKVRVPLYKSMFLNSTYDQVFISLQETELDMIYLLTIQTERGGIIEQLISYVQNF